MSNISRIRVIPILLLDGTGLYKTKKFKNPTYIGDPRNAVKIFNEKEVDELLLVDFTATELNRPIQFDLIEEIVSEAFMPIGYGGGIKTMEDCERLFRIGIEKVTINSAAINNPNLITELSNRFGSQSVVLSVDVKKNIFGGRAVYSNRGKNKIDTSIIEYVKKVESLGAGEILLTSIDKEGSRKGYDIDLIKEVADALSIPVIAHGGANSIEDFVLAATEGNASAVAAGSVFVYHGKLDGILINYPTQEVLKNQLFSKL